MSFADVHLSILELIRCRAFQEKKESSAIDFYNKFVAILREIKRTQPQITSEELQSQAESILFSQYWPNEDTPFQATVPGYKIQLPMMYQKAKGDCEMRFMSEHKRLASNFKNMAKQSGPDYAHFRLEQLMWEVLWPKEKFPGIDPTPSKKPNTPAPVRFLAHPSQLANIRIADRYTPSMSTCSPADTQPVTLIQTAGPKFMESAVPGHSITEEASKVTIPSSSSVHNPFFGSMNLSSVGNLQPSFQPSIPQTSHTQTEAVPQQVQQPIDFTFLTPTFLQHTNNSTAWISQSFIQNASTQTEDRLLQPENGANSCLAKKHSFLESVFKDYTNLNPLSVALKCHLRVEQVHGSGTYPLRIFVEPKFVRTPPNYVQAVMDVNRARKMLGTWGRTECANVWEMIADGWERSDYNGREGEEGKRKRV